MHLYTTAELVAQKPSANQLRKRRRNPIVIVLHNIRSLGNVGLFFRLADAILAEKIYLTGYTGYPRIESDTREERIIAHAEKEINKTAIKLVSFVPWERTEDTHGLLTDLHGSGYQNVAAEQTDASVEYTVAAYRLPLALLFGHEREGLEEKLLKKCDLVVHVPMLGMGNSHNVAMAGTIIAYHILTKVLNSKA